MRVAELGSIVAEGHAGAVAVCGEEIREDRPDAHEETPDRRQVREALLVLDDFRSRRRQRVPTGVGGCSRVVDLQQRRRRLLFEPFARVPLVDAGGRGEVGAGARAALGEHVVQPQAVAEMDGDQLEGSDTPHEEALDERFDLLLDRVLVDGRTHGVLPFDGSDRKA